MEIHNIKVSDIEELIEICREAHLESKYNHITFSANSLREQIQNHILEELAVKVVSANKIVGFLLASKTGFIFSDISISLETIFYVRQQYRGTRCFYLLMKAYNKWSIGIPQLMMPHFAIDNSKTYSALEKLGFSEVGRIYAKGI